MQTISKYVESSFSETEYRIFTEIV